MDFAKILGVSISSLRRWEAGATPSPLAVQQLENISRIDMKELLLKLSEKKRAQTPDTNIHNTTFTFKENRYDAKFTPYVKNGPADQLSFYQKLINLQEHSSYSGDANKYFKRLALLQEVNGIKTAHFQLENPGANAKSWSSDYGPHGFHRYVGRFPSALIRALINFFGANENDIILDPFCGSGTTLLEARMLGVPSIGIEISPLSALISTVKTQFPSSPLVVTDLLHELENFYITKWQGFVTKKPLATCYYEDLIFRQGNSIKAFSNIEKWMTKEALLGTSIIIEFIQSQTGYVKDLLCIALSSKMRSIGNVDVDVVRAEYRKEPRQNVDVLKLIKSQLQKMAKEINETLSTHKDIIANEQSVSIINDSLLNAHIAPNSISIIITSPPYGVESLSYLRTHLLSFRVLEPLLGIDPYGAGEGIIGSEYLSSRDIKANDGNVSNASTTYNDFFKKIERNLTGAKEINRSEMMKNFFEDMYKVISKFSVWLKSGGKVAFVIGNKKLGEHIIPTDEIIKEIFSKFGFVFIEAIAHKLKTNNSNSCVPWQDRIIENEYVLLFSKEEAK